jgi:diaminopimelate epimerase
MKILFNKYEGTGNDFIIVRNSPPVLDHSNSQQVRRLCDRRFGIGADGLILIEECAGYDFSMFYFNADGSPGNMCGNGARCAAHFAMKNFAGFRDLSFLAGDGPHTAKYLGGNTIEVSVTDVTEVRETPDGILADTGVPHLVVFTDNNENADMVAFGRPLRYSAHYAPEGVNVNLVSVAHGRLIVRTYERGVEDETLSCGTGVTASAIAAAITGKIVTDDIMVKARGGTLSVRFRLYDSGATDIHLTGPATFVYSGEIEP